MIWQDSPTKPGEVYYIPDPTHAAIFRRDNEWYLTGRMFGFDNYPLKTNDVAVAKQRGLEAVLRRSKKIYDDLGKLIELIEVTDGPVCPGFPDKEAVMGSTPIVTT